MPTAPKREEIDHRTTKLIVGVVALSLAGLTSAFAKDAIDSISASYYQGGWSQAVFIGFLFAIAAFLLSYNGLSLSEMVLSKVAAIAALGVALFPCECKPHAALVPYVHGLSAAVMFLTLTYFCHAFYRRARAKGYPQANVRAAIYAACGITIALSIAVLALDHFLAGAFSRSVPRLVFYGEAVGLIAFGISWLTASRTLPLITRRDERFSPMKAANPS
ncbi:hypothetical protein SAMN05518800_6895 [Variovorax sp. YR752]|uniref:hypothetical protein n=1 Tax=unclassified Variovorax TaxID=663243 RepID=UPI000BD5C0A4|nr:hypothetical protein [Variovorax sp. YR752]SOE06259.1 hypothetical protein SAMN05518800_6895 [Variovorax sp. YR752]